MNIQETEESVIDVRVCDDVKCCFLRLYRLEYFLPRYLSGYTTWRLELTSRGMGSRLVSF